MRLFDLSCQVLLHLKSSDIDSRIVEILEDFERQMDSNIQWLSEDKTKTTSLQIAIRILYNIILMCSHKNLIKVNFCLHIK